MMISIIPLLFFLLASNSVNGYPEEDLVIELPAQPKVDFKQYGGYVDIDEKSGKSFYYYFVEAQQDADKLPLTLWMNGGPGCSSIGGGAFTELGPFYPTKDGRGLRINPESWNKVSNLLFFEFPVGVGWSYSNTSSDYTLGDDSNAKDMLTMMLKWYEKFTNYKSRPLFLTGESYAGHYLSQLATRIFEYNKQSKGFKFDIKGIAIGNPLLNPDKDIPGVYDFYSSHGMISEELGKMITSECNFVDYVFEGGHNVTEKCNQALTEVSYSIGNDGGYIDEYDVSQDVCHPAFVEQELRLRKMMTKMHFGVDICIASETSFYLNLPHVQKALHANRTNIPYPWADCSDPNVLKYSDEDQNRDMLPLLKQIIKHNIPLWIYSGDQDSVCPLIGTRRLVHKIAQDLKLKVTVPYGVWLFKGQIAGWHIEYGNKLTFATIRGGSHMVPYTQPARASLLFNSFIHGKQLPNATQDRPLPSSINNVKRLRL